MPESFKPFRPVRSILWILGALFLCRVALMFVMPLIEPSECRYAAMARNMAESGDYLVPRFVHDGVLQSFDGKPPLFFQAAAIGCKMFGFYAVSVRLPSLIAAMLILGMLYFTARKRLEPSYALGAVLLCFLSALFYAFAGLSLTDTVLGVGICGALFSYMLFLDAGERRMRKLWSIGFFACLGLGMIAKGPVGVLMAGLPVFVYTVYAHAWKQLRDHAWVVGTLVFLLIAAPWYVLMAHNDPGFLEYFFINENVKRFLTPDYGDRYGSGRESFRGMSLIWFVIANLPLLLLLLLPGFRRRAAEVRTYAADPVVGLAFSACVAPALFWCLTSRVPIYYLLPTVPMCSLWGAVMLRKCDLSELWNRRLLRAAAIWSVLLVGGFLIATICFTYWSEKSPRGIMNKVDSLRESGALPPGPVCFIGRTPYSAEYYAGRGIVNHPEEHFETTLKRAADRAAVLIIHRKNRDYMDANGLLNGIREVAVYGEWTAYEPPVKKEVNP